MNLLSGHGIDYLIDSIQILEGIDIRVEAGELVGLIGPNGAGKSSLLRLLTGVEVSTRGEVRFEEQPLEQISATLRAQRMGYLVQGAMAYWPFSVEQVVEQARCQYVERCARHVHRIVGEEAFVVVDDHRVGQLDTELAFAGLGIRRHVGDQVDGPVDLEILDE